MSDETPSQPNEHTSESVRIALNAVGTTLQDIPFTEEDASALTALLNLAPEKAGGWSFFDQVVHLHFKVTVGLWQVFLLSLMEGWSDAAANNAVILSTLRSMYPSADHVYNDVLDSACSVIEALCWIGYEGKDQKEAAQELIQAIHDHAVNVERMGRADLAYNIIAIGLDLCPPEIEYREQLGRHGLRLGLEAGKQHQILACTYAIASTVIVTSNSDPKKQLNAIYWAEKALERISEAEEQWRIFFGQPLVETLGAHDFTKPLRIECLMLLPVEMRPEELNSVLPIEWPKRISRSKMEEWMTTLWAILQIQGWHLELDKRYLALEAARNPSRIGTSWSSRKFDHPAYRRAVPHLRSFLRESAFDNNLLVLTHELTHVLSFQSGIGLALMSLRVAILMNEITLWSIAEGEKADADAARMQDGIERFGLAPLQDGSAPLLFRTEQSLELTLKAQLLQDIWTPWFEGLAIFGELATDPTYEPNEISKVASCVRNLVDLFPTNEDGSTANPQSFLESANKFVEEFDNRCSKAVHRLGPIRLESYLREPEIPYKAGYIALRSVVSALRRTAGRAMSGIQIFNLLLSATMYSTSEAIPDLAMPASEFRLAATRAMCNWAESFAELSKEEIESFIGSVSDPASAGAWATWSNGHVTLHNTAPADAVDEEIKLRRSLLTQAFSSLTSETDESRISTMNPLLEAALHISSNVARDHVGEELALSEDILNSLVLCAGVLPIGQVKSRFYLNVDEEAGEARLFLQLRTTESQAPDGSPSVNGYSFSIDIDAARLIENEYRMTADPRMDTYRVIDLTGTVSDSGQRIGSHLFAFRYGDWFHVTGCSPPIDKWLNKDRRTFERMRNLIKTRLIVPGLLRVESEILAEGIDGAKRTSAWLDRSMTWEVGDSPIPAEAWASHVRELARKILDDGRRTREQREGAQALLGVLLGDAGLAERLVRNDLKTLMRSTPEMTSNLVRTLFESAMKPLSPSEGSERYQAFARTGFNVLERFEYGYDVKTR